MSFDSKYANTHDMHLPEWGPYSKLYYGLSHIADQDKGLRFDFFVAPSFYRSAKYIFPDALQDCGVHCWETTEDLSYYSYRYEMEWKDRVYADVSYYTYDENTRVMRCSFCQSDRSVSNIGAESACSDGNAQRFCLGSHADGICALSSAQ